MNGFRPLPEISRRHAAKTILFLAYMSWWLFNVGCSGGAAGGSAGTPGGGGGNTTPSITNLSPTSGPVGTAVTITGTNFGASQGSSSTITFNGVAATPTSWSATSIVAPVPAGATTGNVVVTVGGVASNGVAFTVAAQQSSAGWMYVQDSVLTSCNAGAGSCTLQNNNVIPTTAGTIWLVRIHTPNNVTISSVTGGGATWHLCAPCHLFNSATSDNQDIAYGFGGAANTTTVTINLSGAAGTFFGGNFMEILPPAGSVPSFDIAGTATSSTCTTCTGPTLTLRGTDAIIEVLSGNGANTINAWSSPYLTDLASNGIGLNVSTGTGPTVTLPSGGGDITAIAFTSSLGTFAAPPAPISMVHYTNIQTNCSPSCNITIPSTGSGNLLYVEAMDINSSFISSISGGGTWAVPTGANTCQILLTGGFAMSCGYVLSSSSGVTSITLTMGGSGAVQVGVYEASSPSPFTFDTQGSTTNTATFDPEGQALTLGGTNDIIFQSIFAPGGPSGVSFYPLPIKGANFFPNQAGMGVLLNTSRGAPPVWANGGNNITTVTGVAFSSNGGVGILSASLALTPAARSTNGSGTSAVPPVPTAAVTKVTPAFPVKTSVSGRYFVDAAGAPWMMIGDSAHHIVNVMPSSDWPTYFASRQAMGFNTINIMSCSHRNCPPTGATADGQLPFTVTIPDVCGTGRSAYDLAAPNSLYWAKLDGFVNMAASYGQAVLFNPLNLADFMQDLRVSGPAKVFQFGAYLGNRYKDFPNIIWELGGDFHTDTQTGAACPSVVSDNTLVQQLISGLESTDPNHVITIPFDHHRSDSGENSAMIPELSGDALFTYSETYDAALKAYNSTPVLPVLLVEANMEEANVTNNLGSPANALVLRRQMYWAMTSGAAGYIWGNTYVNNSNLANPTWQSQLNTPATSQVALLMDLFTKYPWWTLVPDQDHQVITGGFGTPDPNNKNLFNATYATTAWNTNGTLAITYTPVSTTLSVNMANFSKPMTASWYDPTTGNSTVINGSPFANSGSQSFTTPSIAHSDGTHDWVLLLQ